MLTIIRDVEERISYKLNTIGMGIFFEFEKKLYITLRLIGPENVDIRCFNVNDSISCQMPIDTLVYKCDPVEIKYNLFEEGE